MKKDLTELKEEEQVMGWGVRVYLNTFSSSPYGGQYRDSEEIEVDTWNEAVDMANAITKGLDPKIKEGKAGIFFRNEEAVLYTRVFSRTRTIYVK